MERLNKIKQIALSIVDKYYPDTKCAILNEYWPQVQRL